MITLHHPGTCHQCKKRVPAGTLAHYETETAQITCATCQGSTIRSGRAAPGSRQSRTTHVRSDRVHRAGAGARRQARTLTRGKKILLVAAGIVLLVAWALDSMLLLMPVLLLVMLAFRAEMRWKVGAEGERKTARVLAGLPRGHVVLHDRKVPWGEANLDHVVIGPRGVHVWDTKHYGGVLGASRTQLHINGTDHTRLVQNLSWQEKTIRDILQNHHLQVPVSAGLVFTGSARPLSPRTVQGHLIVGLAQARQVPGTPQLDPAQVARVAQILNAELMQK